MEVRSFVTPILYNMFDVSVRLGTLGDMDESALIVAGLYRNIGIKVRFLCDSLAYITGFRLSTSILYRIFSMALKCSRGQVVSSA
jgi:hypothetical protein